ncbi:hypothetical protein GCM10007921_08490 [Tritonibacter mobilis]|nr:hypothetical protein GCM10007921_08490 [Tritonibacter mobilis]
MAGGSGDIGRLSTTQLLTGPVHTRNPRYISIDTGADEDTATTVHILAPLITGWRKLRRLRRLG